jgi:chromosome segregation ATPase
MTSGFRGYLKLAMAGLLIVSLFSVGADAQKKKKRSRKTRKPAVSKPVITNPEIAPPTTTDANGDVKIISTADQSATEGETLSDTPQPKKPKTSGSSEDMQQTITTLSNQVNRLNDKLSQMQEDDRYQLDMERLTRAEQRAEQIRSQLIDTQSKIADLESKLEQIEYALKPENIDRTTQLIGTVHPEEAREARRKQLENERSRVQAQLKILDTSKTRLETSVANADAEVDSLRAKLNARREQMDASPAPSAPPKKPDQE